MDFPAAGSRSRHNDRIITHPSESSRRTPRRRSSSRRLRGRARLAHFPKPPQSSLCAGAHHRTRAAPSASSPRASLYGRAEIVKRGLVVVVELSPAPRRRSVDSRQRFKTTRPSSRRLRALRRRPRHGPQHHRVLVPVCRLRLHAGSEASCALFDRCSSWRARVATLRTHWQCSCFWATRPPFAHARGNDSLRMAAARASSSFQTSRQQLSWLNSLFAVTDNELSNGTDLIPTIADIPLQDFSEA